MQIKCNLTQGEKLTVMDALIDPDTLEIVPRTRKCTVIREYPKFILADFGVYRESINKASVLCRDVRIWKGWKEE